MDEQHYEYRTGFTQPRKSHRGLVTALLICVIFLCGIVSGLGLLNIHLFHRLQSGAKNGAPVTFSQGDNAELAQPADDLPVSLTLAGMTFQELPLLYQQLYDLPAGLYICRVAPDSNAAALGIAPGDVLTELCGSHVSRLDVAQTLLSTCLPGEQVCLTVYRNGQQIQRTLTVE